MELYECTTEMCHCTLCDFKIKYKRYRVQLPDLKNVRQKQYDNLECILNNYDNDKTLTCSSCKLNSLCCKYILGPYILIDTKDAYSLSTFAKAINIDSENFSTNLDQLPTQISIKINIFVMSGVVQFIPPLDKHGIGHYVAYCRNINRSWTKKNDLLKNKKYVSKKSLPAIKISSILYVKCQVRKTFNIKMSFES